MSWYSWWTGSLGARARRNINGSDTEGSTGKNQRQRVALIVGVTGIVGTSLAEILSAYDAPGGPWKVYGIARRPKPAWFQYNNLQYIQCDVSDKAQTTTTVSALTDVTHLFWVTWSSCGSEAENCESNVQMLTNVLDSLHDLEHVCLQTGGKHYMGSHLANPKNGTLGFHEAPFQEDLPRLDSPNFYYAMEDTLLEKVKAMGNKTTWSVHRPSVIFGFSPCSLMNILGSIAVYAAICKKEGSRFDYPGNLITWDGFMDASDAGLIAEQEVWACLNGGGAKNQAFNITNGDVFRWKQLWRVLAEKLGVEVGPCDGKGFSLAERMRDKGPVWDEIVRENGLVENGIEQVGHWWFVDRILNRSFENVSSMNKSKEFGFFAFRDTQKSCVEWIDKLRCHKIIP